ncbi:MAG: DnaJ domain-containing protein, partial [Myxococcota bacterium]
SLFPVRGDRFLRIAPRLRSDDAVQALLERIDGSHTLWRCLQVARTPRAFAALWVLDATGAIEYRETVENAGDAGGADVKIEIVRPSEESAAPAVAPAAPTSSERPAEASREAAAEQLRHEIEEKCRHLADLDHYEVLGVDSGVDAAAIKRAYLQVAKTYHPDALARSGLDEEVRRKAGKLFAEMGTAYAVLSNPAKRKDYDSSQGGGSEDADRLATAETLFRKGEVLLRLGNFKGALEFLKPAAGLWPEESEYQCALGWALYKKLPSETEAARESLGHAVQLDPQSATALFRLSVVLRELGEADEAASLLERAKQIDPSVS